MKHKLKDPEYYFKVRSAWPNILYGKPRKKRKFPAKKYKKVS